MTQGIEKFRTIKNYGRLTDYAIQINTFLVIAAASFMVYEFQNEFYELKKAMLTSTLGSSFLYFSMFVVGFKVLFLIYLFLHYRAYKPTKSVKDDELPTCTIIVPAYNEGRFVYDTLISISNSNFPKEKIQLIAIDDGSKDDTWEWIKKAKEELGDFVSIYKQPRNMGKRYALYRGFNLATGEVLVTIDSDSLINEDTLRNLVSPFAIDEKCGAVAGNVKIHNIENAMIPKMLSVSFAFSFGFIRAAQSNMKSVLCTPGALSAYRKTAVMNCLEDWINQTFLGVKTDIGEDRAMTNMILKQGYNTRFQSNANVYTNIPETYQTLRKMFTRWERSNVRENIMLSKFALSKFREGNRFNTRVLLFNQWLSIVSAYPSLLVMLLIVALHPVLFFSSTIVSVAVFSIIPALYYSIKYNKWSSIWIFSYNLFYTFTLFWITPYAIVTSNRAGWLTRELPTDTDNTLLVSTPVS